MVVLVRDVSQRRDGPEIPHWMKDSSFIRKKQEYEGGISEGGDRMCVVYREVHLREVLLKRAISFI